jgi:hypothetical protein
MTNVSKTNPAAVPQPANDIHGIKPPIEIANPWMWVWIALAVLALAGLLYWAWTRAKKIPELPPAPVIPPHARARMKLQEALALISQPVPFCVAVSDTIRVYLEERFQFHAPDRTTEEFLHELKATNLLLPDQKQSLGEFLSICDMVKFARYEPGETELRTLHESALRLIDETEPQPEPVQATAVNS